MQRAATLDKGLDVLEAVRAAGAAGLGIREMSRRLGINATTVHNLAWTLCARGYLRQDGATRRFVAGPACAAWAGDGSPLRRLARLAEPLVERCRNDLDESVMLAALDGREIVPLVYLHSSQALRVHEPDVMAEHAYGTAVGKMLLSTLGEAELKAYLRAYPPHAFTARTLATPRVVTAGLARVRRQGHAETRDELTAGVSAAAVLVDLGPEARITAALGASAPSVRMSARQMRKTLDSLSLHARLIRQACDVAGTIMSPAR